MTSDSEKTIISGFIEPDTLKSVEGLVESGRFRSKSHLVDEALKYYVAHLLETGPNNKGGNGNAPTE